MLWVRASARAPGLCLAARPHSGVGVPPQIHQGQWLEQASYSRWYSQPRFHCFFGEPSHQGAAWPSVHSQWAWTSWFILIHTPPMFEWYGCAASYPCTSWQLGPWARGLPGALLVSAICSRVRKYCSTWNGHVSRSSEPFSPELRDGFKFLASTAKSDLGPLLWKLSIAKIPGLRASSKPPTNSELYQHF